LYANNKNARENITAAADGFLHGADQTRADVLLPSRLSERESPVRPAAVAAFRVASTSRCSLSCLEASPIFEHTTWTAGAQTLTAVKEA